MQMGKYIYRYFLLLFWIQNDIFFEIYKAADDLFENSVVGLLNKKNSEENIIVFFRQYAKLNKDTGLEELKLLFNPNNEWFLTKRAMQEILSNIVKKGQDKGELTKNMSADEIVDYIFVLMRGVCYNWCISNGNYDLEEKMISYLKLILIGLKNKE